MIDVQLFAKRVRKESYWFIPPAFRSLFVFICVSFLWEHHQSPRAGRQSRCEYELSTTTNNNSSSGQWAVCRLSVIHPSIYCLLWSVLITDCSSSKWCTHLQFSRGDNTDWQLMAIANRCALSSAPLSYFSIVCVWCRRVLLLLPCFVPLSCIISFFLSFLLGRRRRLLPLQHTLFL